MRSDIRLGVVGATGAVGAEMLHVLEQRDFPYSSLRAFASASSAGKKVVCKGKEITVEAVTNEVFKELDIALFSAGSSITKQFRAAANQAGCLIIDNSSAYRMEDDVPLVIPEINGEDCRGHHGLIAVPNCSAIVMLMAVAPLRALGRISRIIVSTYQAVSGAGAKALAELEEQTRQIVAGQTPTKRVLPYQIAFNLFSHNTDINEYGYNGEEWKLIHESKKILHDDSISITATCIRVPIMRAHSESVNVEFTDKRPTVEQIRSVLESAEGVLLVDDRSANHFPMPLEASGGDNVLVGRIREDRSNSNAIEMFVSGDQLRKGAALDAVQIAEYVLTHDLL